MTFGLIYCLTVVWDALNTPNVAHFVYLFGLRAPHDAAVGPKVGEQGKADTSEVDPKDVQRREQPPVAGVPRDRVPVEEAVVGGRGDAEHQVALRDREGCAEETSHTDGQIVIQRDNQRDTLQTSDRHQTGRQADRQKGRQSYSQSVRHSVQSIQLVVRQLQTIIHLVRQLES
eukprot:1176636-Prorocentrum_minimum.AAC.3